MSRRPALPCSAFQPLFFHFLTFKSQRSKRSRSPSHLLLQGSFKLAMISSSSQFFQSLYYQILTPSFPLCYSRQPRTTLLIHEDPSTHSPEPIFPTSALQNCFHLHISLTFIFSSCFLLLFLIVCACVFSVSSPLHSAGLPSLPKASAFLGGGQTMATGAKVSCWKDHLFFSVWK